MHSSSRIKLGHYDDVEEDEEERKSSLGHSPDLVGSANNGNIYSDDPTSQKARGLLKGRLDPDEVSEEENDDDEVFDPKIDKKPLDVNVFSQDDSPTKEKDNKKLADLYRKVNKANVEVVLNNVTGEASNVLYEKQENDFEEDEDPKLRVDLNAKKLNYSE